MEIPASPPPRPQVPAKRSQQTVPQLEDLFKGSRPKFGKPYEKFISSTQVPHPQAPLEYYDEQADQAAAAAYYGSVRGTEGLRELVTSTHRPDERGYHYVVAKNLYSTVDRHPDGTVRSIYTEEPLQVLKYPDISLTTLSQQDISTIAGASLAGPEVMGAWLGFQRGAATLNCEHVVPQAYFNEKEPMRSDLHHLYACDIKANSDRGDQPYGTYKPVGGRGEVARATLYFMLRYPKVKLPYTPQQVALLKQWSAEDPPDLREKHRNSEIQKLQGNRNPFIDHPEWVAEFTP
ncbi:MAG: endonuclease [Candidatus Eremiobacteraeota bacterium]|nr:endonuclease [Candidatus Eremiobacteraeota bacterium]